MSQISLAAAPMAVATISPVTTNEDSGSVSVDITGVFEDADVTAGTDTLTFTLNSSGDPLFDSLAVSGSSVTLVLSDHANGGAVVTVTATDTTGDSAQASFSVDVLAVNDPVVLVNPIGNRAGLEDNFSVNVDLNTVFEDADVLADGATLSFRVVSVSNPALFATAQILPSGTLDVVLAADANGQATVVVEADDGLVQATDQFSVDVSPVNDLPVPANDSVSINEDSGVLMLDALANDYQAEGPAQIEAITTGNSADDDFQVLDPTGNIVAGVNGTLAIVNNQIHYEPKENFYGQVSFTYTIRDSSGGTSGLGDVSVPATVTITVSPVDDAPTARERVEFSMFQDTTLQVNAADVASLLAFAYDAEGARLDSSGQPVGASFNASLSTAPSFGQAVVAADGSFTYTPPTGFNGSVQFGYRLSDGNTQSQTDLTVRILVTSPLPLAPTPPAGQVAVNFNLANSPLEQTTGVPPNVMILMDDSGSMDWHISTALNANDGVLQLSNAGNANVNPVATSYYYLWDLPDNVYGPESLVGRLLPTEDALGANASTVNNEFGVWRARNHKFNVIYYNPAVRYQPWPGLDAAGQLFSAADPRSSRLNPRDPTDTIDLLALRSYSAQRVPTWLPAGSSIQVNVVDDYTPRYFTSAAAAPLAHDAAHSEVRIEIGSGPLPGDRFPGGPDRSDCAQVTICSYAEELQNFANWFQYYRKREYLVKASVAKVIEGQTSLRVGYETVNQQASAPIALMNDLPTQGAKRDLLDQVYSVNSAGGTALREALQRVGEIYRCSGGSSSCPVLPTPAGTCQQNFTLMFSDGYWNAGAGVSGNSDSDGSSLFDGGRYSDSVAATLADTAMFYYETDLHPALADRVPPGQRDIQGAASGVLSSGSLMHQHMKTFAIAFGVNGALDASTIPANPAQSFVWPDPAASDEAKVDDMLHSALNGRGDFLSTVNPDQLQSALEDTFIEFADSQSSLSAAAFGSTALRDQNLLFRGFFNLGNNSGNLTATRVNPDGTLQATPLWSAAEQLRLGNLSPSSRRVVTYDSTSRVGIPFQETNLTPGQLATLDSAQIAWVRGDAADEQPAGALRARADDARLGDIVNSAPVFIGAPRALNRDQAPFPTTDLYSTFANTQRARDAIVYVGANDGMLHGFDAATGDERYAFIPNKLIEANRRFRNEVSQLTQPLYSHKYFVDLTPRFNDVYMRSRPGVGSKSWNTVLLGGLGAGGKGYYALNVTRPNAQFATDAAAAQTVLWEFTDEDDTYPRNPDGTFFGGGLNAITDPDGQPVKDLGYALSLPTMAMSNRDDGGGNKDWIAIFGNGQNSTAGVATLFALFMDDGLNGWAAGDFVKISTGAGVPITTPANLVGYPNGLGTPAVVDTDLNGTADLVYAGDRLGNLYRFDISSTNSNNWSVVRLFTAENAAGERQPILSRPLIVPHPERPGFIVTFGTGSYLTADDASSTEIQSIYGIWDDLQSVTPVTGSATARADHLIEQTITNVVDDSVTPAQTRRIVSRNTVTYAPAGSSTGIFGWYIDLDMTRASTTSSGATNGDTSGNAPPAAQFPGERAIRNFIFRNGSVITPTVLPSNGDSTCFGPRPGAILVFDLLTGGDARKPIIDFNTDGVVDSGDLVSSGGEDYSAGLLFDAGALNGPLVDLATVGALGDTDFLFVSGGSTTEALRIADIADSHTGRLSWREVEE